MWAQTTVGTDTTLGTDFAYSMSTSDFMSLAFGDGERSNSSGDKPNMLRAATMSGNTTAVKASGSGFGSGQASALIQSRKRKGNFAFEVDFEAKMRSPSFLNQSEADKFGQVGQALNRMQAHNFRMDKMVSDLSHQYSKYCLKMTGEDLPKSSKEDCVAIWMEGMMRKFAIVIREDERLQFRACHRVVDGSIVAAFTTSIKGSVFD